MNDKQRTAIASLMNTTPSAVKTWEELTHAQQDNARARWNDRLGWPNRECAFCIGIDGHPISRRRLTLYSL